MDKLIKNSDLFLSQVAVMSVIGRQQASMHREPLLTEIITHQLRYLEIDVVHIFGQLVMT